jgi:hypothetical protein
VDLLIRRDYTPGQIERAKLRSAEFRRNRYTSGSAHLDDMIALGKALILCDQHARKFKPKQARYCLHPAENLRRVQGNCDCCKMFGFATLYLPEKLALDERKKAENYRRATEYGHIVAQ